VNDQLEANKRIVREWHDLAINQCKPEEAVAKYLGSRYRQHNPGAGDGPEPFIQAVKRMAQNFPDFRMESKRIIAEGDCAALHSHSILKPGGRGYLPS
jgi:predicted SnoaL-like aldol condensation-catalyzing enzyme